MSGYPSACSRAQFVDSQPVHIGDLAKTHPKLEAFTFLRQMPELEQREVSYGVKREVSIV
jgi:hypothetical protein